MKNHSITITLCGLMCAATIAFTALYSSHAQSNGTIHGCVKRNNGQLRVVTALGQCNPSEDEISWSVAPGSFGGTFQRFTFTILPGQSHRVVFPQTRYPIHFALTSEDNFSILDFGVCQVRANGEFGGCDGNGHLQMGSWESDAAGIVFTNTNDFPVTAYGSMLYQQGYHTC